MKLLLTGVNHKTAPVETRERLAFPEPAIGAALERLRGGPGISEALILSTCNRVEITVASEDDVDPRSAVEAVMRGSASPSEIYRYEGRDAIAHLFRVAASLDAMVVGEPQILGQMKSAYALAKSAGTMNGLLDGVVSRAVSVAKRVRTETGIGQMAVSVSYAAVELARNIFGSLSGRSVLLIGSGKMSELAARHLHRSGAKRILVTNRTGARADEMAALFAGTAVPYAQFRHSLPDVDIVITSSGAPDYILGPEDLQRAVAARRNKPMFVIDIAVPRNVDPAVNGVDNVFLYDIDDLQGVVNGNLAERLKEAARAERIIAEEVDRMLARLKVQQVVPVIASFAGTTRNDSVKRGRKSTAQECADGRARGGCAYPRDRRQDRSWTDNRAAPPGWRTGRRTGRRSRSPGFWIKRIAGFLRKVRVGTNRAPGSDHAMDTGRQQS